MIDLSNNNGIQSAAGFKQAYLSGQRRAFFKLTEGTDFVDGNAIGFIAEARAARFKCGVYHFGHPDESPTIQAKLFASRIPPGLELIPYLDIEIGTPGQQTRIWIKQFLYDFLQIAGKKPGIYSYSSFLQSCQFEAPVAPLWLAAYGRDDGKQHPVTSIPHPWSHLAAHQFTSRATVLGIHGLCDLSNVLKVSEVDA